MSKSQLVVLCAISSAWLCRDSATEERFNWLLPQAWLKSKVHYSGAAWNAVTKKIVLMILAQATIEHLPLADNSVDMIFTDPPYPKEYLPCYEWLAKEAMRVLKPGGFVLAMCGGIYLNKIYRIFDDEGLKFFWEYNIHLTGWASGIVWTRSFPKTTINVRNKPILAYSKGDNTPRTSTISLFNGSEEDKRYHEWGQDVASARYYIDCFSHKDDLVCDPFIGGGTTAVACMALQRRFVGFDIDMNALITSRDRIAGKRKENLHELPLFRQSVPAPFSRLVFDATNGKAELKTEIVK